MTSAASHLNLDSSGHPDVEAISEYVEDLLPPEAAAELAAHLSGCPDCLETRDALDEIRCLLGETETPRLPSDIADRIDAALAAEARTGTAAPAADAAEPAAHSGSSSSSGRPLSGASTAPPRSTGATGPAGRRPGRGAAARRLRRAALGIAALAVVGFLGSVVLHPGTNTNSASSSSAVGQGGVSLPVVGAATPQTFTAAGFTAQIQGLLQPATGDSKHPLSMGTGETPAGTDSASAGIEQLAVPGCVLGAVARTGQQPLTAALGSYHGDPVYALVYPDTKDPAHSVDAYLVDRSCSAPSGSSSPVLLQQTVPRP